MKPAKKALPMLLALCFVLGLSYYLFSIYKPGIVAQVKGARAAKENKNYLDSIPLFHISFCYPGRLEIVTPGEVHKSHGRLYFVVTYPVRVRVAGGYGKSRV